MKFRYLLLSLLLYLAVLNGNLLDCIAPSPDFNIKKARKMAKGLVAFKKRIRLPKFPNSFNPSLLQTKDGFLLAFRYCPIAQEHWRSYIGLVHLDESLNPISDPYILWMREKENTIPHQTEDPRLFQHRGELYLMFNDNPDVICPSALDRRDIYISKLLKKENRYIPGRPKKLFHSEKHEKILWQKNWSPFNWKEQLCITYGINPHEVLTTDLESGNCNPVALTAFKAKWKWGHLRGGTPALPVDGRYLAFFHSSTHANTKATRPGQTLLHYYMGAYIFSSEPPFEIQKVTPFPITAGSFYTKSNYDKRVIFPSGFVDLGSYLLISYGKDDNEIWIAGIDKKKLMDFMVPVENQ